MISWSRSESVEEEVGSVGQRASEMETYESDGQCYPVREDAEEDGGGHDEETD